MSLEQFSEIIKMLALVSGGLWAAWTFHKLQKVRAAELDNNQKVGQIQKARMEQEELRTRLLRQQPQLAIRLEIAEMASLPETGKSLLCITVTLKNEGEQNLQVSFDDSALTVGRIVFGKNGKQGIGDVHRFAPFYFTTDSDVPQTFSDRIIRVGQERKMAIAVLPVAEPGAYFVQFNALYGKVSFDGDKSSPKDLAVINAVEQAFVFASGKARAAEPTC